MTFPSDPIVARTRFGDIEDRMGLTPIEELLAERDELVKQAAPLRAVHGPFGTYEAQRKIEVAVCAQIVRTEAAAKGTKVTEAFIGEAAHANERYQAFILTATAQKIQWIELEDRIQGINDLINRGQAVARYLSAEVSLGR